MALNIPQLILQFIGNQTETGILLQKYIDDLQELGQRWPGLLRCQTINERFTSFWMPLQGLQALSAPTTATQHRAGTYPL